MQTHRTFRTIYPMGTVMIGAGTGCDFNHIRFLCDRVHSLRTVPSLSVSPYKSIDSIQ